MADNTASENVHPAMDMDEHRRSFHGFVEVSKTGTVLCLNALVDLIFVYKHFTVTASLFLVAMLIAGTVGLMMKSNGWVPGAVLMVLGLLGVAVTG